MLCGIFSCFLFHAVTTIVIKAKLSCMVYFQIFLGEKYGPCLLPSTISQDEFDKILHRTRSVAEIEVEKIRKRLQEIEDLKNERERQLQDEDDCSIDTPTGLAETGESPEQRTESTKYESRKFKQYAETIKREAQVIKALQDKEESLPSPSLLLHWYKLDENHVPPVYRLQKIR